MTTKFIGIKELRQNMAKITKRAEAKNERLIILRKNKPIFELRPLSDKEFALEQLIQDINTARADVRAGRVYSQPQMEKMFGL